MLAPPSTRSEASERPRSRVMASRRSVFCWAMPMRDARAMWAFVVARVSPVMEPRASGRQWGAPRPVRAGTTMTPASSSTLRASGSIWDDVSMMPRLSLSHWTRAPATKALPSSAYVVSLLIFQAQVDRRPCRECTISCPVLRSKNAPVPNVHLASPVWKQFCPKSAAC